MKRYLFILFLCLPFMGKGQIITTVAGTGGGGYNGDSIPATSATLGYFSCIAADTFGNIYIADPNNKRVRKVNSGTGIIVTVAGNGTDGFSGDGALAINAQFDVINHIAVNRNGDLFITDAQNQRIRKVDRITGIITTVAGNGTIGFSGDGGLATSASLNFPEGIAIDKSDNLYIADNSNHRVRKVDVNGIITTIGGTGDDSCNGDGGQALSADIQGIYGICVDSSGNIYLACKNNARIRKIDQVTGIVTTVAGNGSVGFSGDGAAAESAQLNWPYAVTCDEAGTLFIADQVNNRIRKVSVTGIISTVAGDGVTGFDGDGGIADTATLNRPGGVAVDTCGNLFIADKMNKRVRKVAFNDSCGILSVKKVSTHLTFTLSPNPTTSNITITSSTTLKKLHITNTLGATILQQEINTNKTTLDLANQSTGIYILTLYDEHGNRRTEKIIKQ